MGFGPREIIFAALIPGAVIASLPGCGGSGEERRPAGSPAPGAFPGDAARAESTFNPSDYGIETWETEPQAGDRSVAAPPADSTIVTAPDTIAGFRVQVTTTEDIDYASHLRDSLFASLEGEWVYVVYHPPYYKIRVGNFSDRFAAAGLLETLRRRGFPDAWIVPDRVLRNPPPPTLREPPLLPDTSGGGGRPR